MGHAHSLVRPWATASEIGMHFLQPTFFSTQTIELRVQPLLFSYLRLKNGTPAFFLVLRSHPMVGADHRVLDVYTFQCLRFSAPQFPLNSRRQPFNGNGGVVPPAFSGICFFGMVVSDHSSSSWSNTHALVMFSSVVHPHAIRDVFDPPITHFLCLITEFLTFFPSGANCRRLIS